MGDYSYKKMFDFLKSKFDGTKAEAWNVPPDFVFENAISQINKRKREKRALWYKRAGILGFLLLTVGAILFFSYKVERIESDVAELKVQSSLKEIPVEVNKDHIFSEESKDASSNKILTNAKDQKSISDITIDNKKTINQINTKANKTSYPNEVKSSVNPTSFENNLSDLTYIKNDVAVTVELNNSKNVGKNATPKKAQTQVDKVSPRSIIGLIESITPLTQVIDREDVSDLNIEADFTEITTQSKVSLPMSIGLRLENNQSCFSMTNPNFDANKSLSGYDNYRQGNGFSINALKPLSKNFSIAGAVSVTRVANQSSLSETSPIDVSNYVADGSGAGTYVTDMTIETPLGEYTSNLAIEMEESLVNAKEKMNNITEVDQSLTYVSLKLGIQYQLSSQKKFNPFFGSGFSYNRILSMNNAFETAIYMDDKYMESIFSNPNELEGYNSSFLSFYAESGLAYKVTEHSNLILAVGLDRSLTSLKSDAFSRDASTDLQQYKLSLGYNFAF